MKEVILVRMDLKMDKGKLAVQCSHAAVEAVLKTNRDKVNDWLRDGGKKVTLKVESLKELQKYKQEAEYIGLKTALITDEGKTFFTKPTMTCLAIGPDDEDKIDRVTGKLKML